MKQKKENHWKTEKHHNHGPMSLSEASYQLQHLQPDRSEESSLTALVFSGVSFLSYTQLLYCVIVHRQVLVHKKNASLASACGTTAHNKTDVKEIKRGKCGWTCAPALQTGRVSKVSLLCWTTELPDVPTAVSAWLACPGVGKRGIRKVVSRENRMPLQQVLTPLHLTSALLSSAPPAGAACRY